MTPRDPLVADDDLDDDPPPDRRLTGSEQKLQRWVVCDNVRWSLDGHRRREPAGDRGGSITIHP